MDIRPTLRGKNRFHDFSLSNRKCFTRNKIGRFFQEIVKPISWKNTGRMSILQKSSSNTMTVWWAASPPCHSRESGNPVMPRRSWTPCLRRGDRWAQARLALSCGDLDALAADVLDHRVILCSETGSNAIGLSIGSPPDGVNSTAQTQQGERKVPKMDPLGVSVVFGDGGHRQGRRAWRWSYARQSRHRQPPCLRRGDVSPAQAEIRLTMPPRDSD